MKKIQIEIRVDEETGRIGTAWVTGDYSRESVSDNLELVGLLENTKDLIKDRIKVLQREHL